MALMHVDFFSDVLGMGMNMDVILPQKTSKQIGMEGMAEDGSYKTVYLLHGMSDDHTVWQRRTAIERYMSRLGIAVVMPSTHLGFYTDTTYGMRYWTFVSEELPRIWADKYEEYLGVRPKDVAEGVLQDIHWSQGSFGYFPSYALGSAFGAQMYAYMKKEWMWISFWRRERFP